MGVVQDYGPAQTTVTLGDADIDTLNIAVPPGQPHALHQLTRWCTSSDKSKKNGIPGQRRNSVQR